MGGEISIVPIKSRSFNLYCNYAPQFRENRINIDVGRFGITIRIPTKY